MFSLNSKEMPHSTTNTVVTAHSAVITHQSSSQDEQLYNYKQQNYQ